jgi:hypothetical protein
MLYKNYNVTASTDGYAEIRVSRKHVKVHIMVWEEKNGPKPKGFIIHHKDEDKMNFSLDNLELLTDTDHRRVHAGWLRENGVWIKRPCLRCHKLIELEEPYCTTCKVERDKEWSARNKERELKGERPCYICGSFEDVKHGRCFACRKERDRQREKTRVRNRKAYFKEYRKRKKKT